MKTDTIKKNAWPAPQSANQKGSFGFISTELERSQPMTASAIAKMTATQFGTITPRKLMFPVQPVAMAPMEPKKGNMTGLVAKA